MSLKLNSISSNQSPISRFFLIKKTHNKHTHNFSRIEMKMIFMFGKCWWWKINNLVIFNLAIHRIRDKLHSYVWKQTTWKIERNFLCIVLSSLDTQYLRRNFYFSKTHHNLHYAVNPMVIHMILKKRLYFSFLPRTTSSKQHKSFHLFFYSKYRVPSKASEFCWTRNFLFSLTQCMCSCVYVCMFVGVCSCRVISVVLL